MRFIIQSDLEHLWGTCKLDDLGMKQVYLHTGNPTIDKSDFPFVKDILSKGNFMETMGKLGIK